MVNTNFKKNNNSDKEGYFIMIKGKIHQKEIKILNVYVSNRTLNYTVHSHFKIAIYRTHRQK